jgi:cytochrome subunit of sulfide dehydrogenase
MRLLLAILFAGALALPAAAQTAPPNALNACGTCHGADLKGAGPMPPLRGHDAEYIKKAMTEFRAGSRPATVMTRLAKGYSDTEIDIVAQQIAAMK